MDKIGRIALTVSALSLLLACENSVEYAVSGSDNNEYQLFTATREGVSIDTKTVRMDDGSTWWNASEEISVFYGSGTEGGNKLVSQNTSLQEVVEFSGPVNMSGSGKEFWAVYPYSADNACDGTSITTIIPEAQIGSEGNFSGDVFPAIAKAKSLDLAFWNICGGIKFFVSRSDIKSVTFKGNGGELLVGKVRVAFNADGRPEVAEILDSKAEVTLIAPDGGALKAGKSYYVSLLPTALDSGFTMTFTTADSKGVFSSDKPQSVKRSIFGVLKNIDSKVSEWERTESDAVDLGLPSGLKWASWNVGASAPEDYGDYFAWGETEPKENYDWSTYKWCNGTDNSFTKYCTHSSYGTVDHKTVLDLSDDAAHTALGKDWRMPTDAEWTELCENCAWKWIAQNGVNGWLVTSNTNSNSIFLPAAGRRLGTNLGYVGTYGRYWSSSLNPEKPSQSKRVSFKSDEVKRNNYDRTNGQSVRPVYDDRIHPESVTLNKAELSLYVGHTEQLTATILPENATDKTVKWSSDKAEVASVDENGNVTAIATGATVIRINTTDGNLSAACEVVVIDNTIETISGTGSQKYNYLGSENTYSVLLKGTATVEDGYDLDKYFYYSADYMTLEALRMSGTKVSATASGQMFQVNVDKLKENTTYYFVACVDLKIKGNVKKQLFGEVKTVTTPEYYLPPYVDFNLPSGVKWGTMNIGATNPTKLGTGYEWGHSGYHDQSDYQTGDILPLDEDVAHKKLGGYWRTPTREEWVELFHNCSCSYSMYHEGGTGLVVSKGGAKIFIPLQDYWTATCCTPYWTSASGGWQAATAYVIQGKSTSYEYYIDKKAVNTNAAITSKCKIRAVYVDR